MLCIRVASLILSTGMLCCVLCFDLRSQLEDDEALARRLQQEESGIAPPPVGAGAAGGPMMRMPPGAVCAVSITAETIFLALNQCHIICVCEFGFARSGRSCL